MSPAPVKAKRSYHVDNAKAVLVFLVILAHLLSIVLLQERHNALFSGFYKLINLITIPCFVFISGFFTKKDIKLIDAISKFIVPLIVFQIVFHLLGFLLGLDEKLFTPLGQFLFIPYGALWYLLSLFFWTLLIKLINEKYLVHFIILSIVLAVVIGCFPFFGRKLSTSRTIYYFPFFLLGFFFRSNDLLLLIKPTILWKLLCILIFSAVIFWCFKLYPSINVRFFHGADSFNELDLSNNEGMMIRIQILALSIVAGICFFSLVPANRIFFTRYGAITLQIYLFHDFFIHFVLVLNVLGHAPFDLSTLVLALFIGIIIFLITSLSGFNKVLQTLTCFSRKQLSKIVIPEFLNPSRRKIIE